MSRTWDFVNRIAVFNAESVGKSARFTSVLATILSGSWTNVTSNESLSTYSCWASSRACVSHSKHRSPKYFASKPAVASFQNLPPVSVILTWLPLTSTLVFPDGSPLESFHRSASSNLSPQISRRRACSPWPRARAAAISTRRAKVTVKSWTFKGLLLVSVVPRIHQILGRFCIEEVNFVRRESDTHGLV